MTIVYLRIIKTIRYHMFMKQNGKAGDHNKNILYNADNAQIKVYQS